MEQREQQHERIPSHARARRPQGESLRQARRILERNRQILAGFEPPPDPEAEPGTPVSSGSYDPGVTRGDYSND